MLEQKNSAELVRRDFHQAQKPLRSKEKSSPVRRLAFHHVAT